MRILKSLEGKLLGLGRANPLTGVTGPLIAPGGFMSGDDGSQFDLIHPRKVVWFNDFLGTAKPDDLVSVEGTDSATSDLTILASGKGGVLRLTTGDAGTGLAADQEEVVTALNWYAAGGLAIEARLKLSAITTCWAFFGFTDNLSLEGPIVSAASADTFTTNATDAVGIMFDTRMSTKNWWLTGVANDVDATMQNSGFAPVADTYEVWRIEIDIAGKATFYRNGVQIGTQMVGALTPTIALTPCLSCSKTSVTASMTNDYDYLYIAMGRNAAGAIT